jgi:hypothetical protein
MQPNDVGRFRFCPACTAPVMAPDFASEDQDDPAFDYTSPRCSSCNRPWIACPCEPPTTHSAANPTANTHETG